MSDERDPSFDGAAGAMRRLDALLGAALAAARRSRGEAADPYRGLYLGHDEAARLLDPAAPASPPPLREPGAWPRLDWLAEAFALTPVEVELLLLAAAPELGLRYQRLFGYLQDDMTRRRPSVDLAFDLLGASPAEKLAAWRILAPDAPLLRSRLLALLDDPDERGAPLPGRFLAPDERVVAFLLGDDTIDRRLAPFARVERPRADLGELLLPEDVARHLALLARPAQDARVAALQGPDGTGKRTAAGAVCCAIGRGLALLVVDGARAPADEAGFAAALRLLWREAVLQGAALYWEDVDALLGDEAAARRELLLREAAGHGLIFLAGEAAWQPAGLPEGVAFHQIAFPRPGHAARAELWARMLGGAAEPGVDLGALAGAYRLSAAQIRDAAATARTLAGARDPEGARVSAEELRAASRAHATPRLGGLARRVAPRGRWEDLVLPGDRAAQLRELCDQARHRAQVYEGWGFERKLAYGRGLVALFAGPSGTGKTMAASLIAGELGLDLYAIDLSAVVSKYIGETEKHLARIFAEAESAGAVLLFDEADALFGKRSEVHDAHDRYANLEVAYLLQRVEAYEGVVILATNLRKNLDEAFVRRMQFIVDFPPPGEAERLRIWEQIWPPELPRDPALDLGLVARRFEIPGGNIRNIALGAAMLAAANGGVVGMGHLLHAARREYQKMGKFATDRDFALEPERGAR